MILDCTYFRGSTSRYTIQGERGEWKYSYSTDEGRGKRYVFYRFASNDPNRRVTRSLSQQQVKAKVSKIASTIDLTKFEAFNNQ
ncbi:hypothetical protein WA1_51530 [Scytonema hofmannii PCC 7110]|uniref:Uncharacterized protein n=1 Tax=Scytonema hofmannii PCC 7110 TaxID=128403 RepID=A0A139WPX6_9CYAN|nr:hypothetical protein [Scytonema hofmannii]KYC34477.1 hypothetical protein WA1_51530 [Scytonema hofmannii PCC 7110]